MDSKDLLMNTKIVYFIQNIVIYWYVFNTEKGEKSKLQLWFSVEHLGIEQAEEYEQ